MARHPTMTSADGVWQVEVVTTRGAQSYRVRRLDGVPPPGTGWGPTGRVCRSVGEVRALLGDAFDTLHENRAKRFDGGR